MTYNDFIRLVASMRQAQKEYFRTRSKDVLRQSIDLEKQVDRAVEEYLFSTKEEIENNLL